MNIEVENMLPILEIEDLDDDLKQKLEPNNESDPAVESTVDPPNPENDPADPPQETNVENQHQLSTAFYNELIERGVAGRVDGKEEYSWDDIDGVLKHYSEDLPMRVATSMINAAPEEGRNLVNFILSKQDSLTKEELTNYFKEHLEIMQLPESFDNDSARNFLKNHYKERFRDSQVNAMLDSLEDEEALIDEANKIKAQRKTAQDNAVKAERTKKQNEQKQFVQSLSQEFDSLSWNNDRINQVKESIISGRGNDLLSKIVNSPNGLIHLYDFMSYFDANTGKFDLGNYIQISNSAEAKKLKDVINENMFTSGTDSTKQVNKDVDDNKFDLSNYEPVF